MTQHVLCTSVGYVAARVVVVVRIDTDLAAVCFAIPHARLFLIFFILVDVIDAKVVGH